MRRPARPKAARWTARVIHVSDGQLAQIPWEGSGPSEGDWLAVGDQTYAVTQVVWNPGERLVVLLVDDPGD
jgi:hypothetical protein